MCVVECAYSWIGKNSVKPVSSARIWIKRPSPDLELPHAIQPRLIRIWGPAVSLMRPLWSAILVSVVGTLHAPGILWNILWPFCWFEVCGHSCSKWVNGWFQIFFLPRRRNRVSALWSAVALDSGCAPDQLACYAGQVICVLPEQGAVMSLSRRQISCKALSWASIYWAY